MNTKLVLFKLFDKLEFYNVLIYDAMILVIEGKYSKEIITTVLANMESPVNQDVKTELSLFDFMGIIFFI